MWTVNQQAPSLQYTLQNFAISVYAKLNGTPWTVNQDKAISDELVIGVGFAELSGSRSDGRQRYVGVTTVFSGDGTYLLGNVSKECAYDGYADMVRSSMLSILKELKARNNWHPGDTVRVIFHAHRPLKRVDVAKILFACTREIGAEQDIQLAFVTVSHEHPFFIMDRSEMGAVLVLCHKIIDRAMLTSSDGKADEKIVALCRRFPLLVQALQNRQWQRPPFEVNDEYDVQDILHGILQLHFDDVRPEEVTPSALTQTEGTGI